MAAMPRLLAFATLSVLACCIAMIGVALAIGTLNDSRMVAFTAMSDLRQPQFVALVDVDHTITYRLMVNPLSNTVEPEWSPDGETLLVASGFDGQWQYYAVRGSQRERIEAIPFGAIGARYAPDGQRVVYYQLSSATNTDIFITDLATGDLTRVTNNREPDAYPVWSPDGRYIAFASWRGERLQTGIYLYDVATGEQFNVDTQPTLGISPFDWSWSPDGSELIYAVEDGNYVSTVYRYDIATRQRRKVDNALTPSWSPSGEQVILAGGNLFQLQLFDLDSGESRTIFQPDGDLIGNYFSLWSPDGNSILTGVYSRAERNILTVIDGVESGEITMRRITPYWLVTLDISQAVWRP